MPVLTSIYQRLSRSQIFADYERAFVAATGLPLQFQARSSAAKAQEVPSRTAHPNENPFCALMAETEAGCKMCREMDQRLQEPTQTGARSESCEAGLWDTAVPVSLRGEIVGYLRTGQVALRKPKKSEFNRIARTLVGWGLATERSKLEALWSSSKVLKPEQYEAFVDLLKVFAGHLSLAGEQMQLSQADLESPLMRKARTYIHKNQHEDLRIEEVAKFLNISVFYFCKVFKKTTGMTFTEYLSHERVSKACHLLANPHARISEVAFEAGFQSLTHFNRVFRKLTGQSPTLFRAQIESKRKA